MCPFEGPGRNYAGSNRERYRVPGFATDWVEERHGDRRSRTRSSGMLTDGLLDTLAEGGRRRGIGSQGHAVEAYVRLALWLEEGVAESGGSTSRTRAVMQIPGWRYSQT